MSISAEYYDEHEVVARGLGKWSDVDIPKAGWSSERVFDLGKGTYRTCEMCETVQIRFVHVMVHKIGLRLEAGCICAGHMAEDIVGARARDDGIQRAANRVSRRAAALDKARRQLERIKRSTNSLSETQESTSTLERLRRLAIRRCDAAKADALRHDCYASEVAQYHIFLRDIDAAITALNEQVTSTLRALHQAKLEEDINSPKWRRTDSGFGYTSIDGDRAQVFSIRGQYHAMYKLKGADKPVWSQRKFRSADEAQEIVLAVIGQQLRKAGRLPKRRDSK
ncbi:MAG: hypothetical protein KF895_08125 [Parvibaculum sp.]|nr:hypothetical protein [Parvibaculum sp.]